MTPRVKASSFKTEGLTTVASNLHWILVPFSLPLTLFALTWRTKTISTQRCTNIIVAINNSDYCY